MPLDIEIYCDESCLEALSNKHAHHYTGIGSIWLKAEHRDLMKAGLRSIKDKYGIRGEFKWDKVSPRFLDFYKEIVDFFFTSRFLRFRVILIESNRVNNKLYNNSDTELGFYKFYYQLLHNRIHDHNNYQIFLDHKKNRDRGRLHELHGALSNANIFSNIKSVQAIHSEESLGIQLADLLTGIVTAKFNCKTTSEAKLSLIDHIESTYLEGEIARTYWSEKKFNVFKINLNPRW